jgi:hypothetical protein
MQIDSRPGGPPCRGLTMSTSAKNALAPISEETGDLLAEFQTGSGHHVTIIVGVPFLFALFIGCWIYSLTKWDGDLANGGFIAGTVILLGLGGFFLIAWVISLSALRWRLSLFQNGLLYRKASSFRWIPWRDVSRYHERHVIMNGIPLGHHMFLHLKRGKKIVIEQFFKNSLGIAQDIKSCLVPVLTREAEEELGKHQAVDFQFLKVSKDGLQTSSEFLPWKDVESLAIEDNKGIDHHVVVRVPGKKKPWLDVPVTAFPNLDVFLGLADKLASS